MKQHSSDISIPTAADDAVDEADSAVAASKTTDETMAKTTDKISSKTTNDTLPLPCDSADPRLSRIALTVCSAIGVALAAAIVWAWFPHGSAAWTNPLHEIDAPAHYYFIRKILGEGVGAATHLRPNDEYYPPLFHLLAGGATLGAVYMATDYSTSPMTHTGMLIYGVGIGIITVLIRLWGAYPEGMSFAILIMNACVPLINKYVKPKRFGVK